MKEWKVCVTVLSKGTKEAISKIKKAEQLADLIELRLDYMEEFNLRDLINATTLPLLITYRSPEEGGFKKDIDPYKKIESLKEAIELGVEYVDIEYEFEKALRDELIRNKGKANLVLSKHFFEPVQHKILEEYAKRLFDEGADIGKLIGYASCWEDNLIFLNLVEKYSRMGYKFISFAMGPYGTISRIMCPMLGGAWTYACLSEEEKAASGQLTVYNIKKIWELITGAKLSEQ